MKWEAENIVIEDEHLRDSGVNPKLHQKKRGEGEIRPFYRKQLKISKRI